MQNDELNSTPIGAVKDEQPDAYNEAAKVALRRARYAANSGASGAQETAPARPERTPKTGWHQAREYWVDGQLVGWIGGCFDPNTLVNTGYYGQATDPVRFLVKNVSRAEAAAVVEEAYRAK